jgi:hypothetical protein
MAKAMRMQNRKNYRSRCHKSFNGNVSPSASSDKSKYLAIKYDIEHGIMISADRKKFIEEYELNNCIKKL